MAKKTILPLLCGLLFFTSSLALAEDDAKILVTAGTEALTQAEFNLMLTGVPPQLKAMLDSQPELLQSMLKRWANFSIMVQEAKTQGIDKEASIQAKIKDMTSRILVEEFITRNTGKAEVSPKAIQTYYDDHKSEFSHGEMIKAQHILIKVADSNNNEQVATAKEKILAIKTRLEKGESFDVLAQKLSDDLGSKENGGDLGFFEQGSMVPEFEEVAFNSKKGVVSEPVKTQYGWHLIKVIDTKGPGQTPLAEVSEAIKAKVQAESQQAEMEGILASLQKKFPVTIH